MGGDELVPVPTRISRGDLARGDLGKSVLRKIGPFILLAVALAATGCNEVRGRKKMQEAAKLYHDGQYKEAIAAFEEAEKMVPDFWKLWLNKGYTCRQMIIPGAKTPENVAASKCALGAFIRLQELKPDDSRGELLYVQTLFDAEEWDTLVKMYGDKYQKNPKDIDAVSGLIQVYTKWNKVEEALEWYTKKAEIQANDAESQYAVGVFIWGQLMQKGGGPDKQLFDPRPDPNKPKAIKLQPAFGYGDIISQQRIDMADKGVEYLHKAMKIREKYPEAMTYINLLYRQKAIAFFDQPDEWQKAVDESKVWWRKSLEAQGKPVPAAPLGDPSAKPAGEGAEPAAADAKVTKKPAKKSKKAVRRGKRGRK
jgi:tetratricopeptide (TPR) repeat protein